MTESLEKEFGEAMLEIYRLARSECRYNASYFIQMVNDRGGLQTAKHLLSIDDPQSGFQRLWECGRLDLTVEAQAIDSKYRTLFTPKEIQTAKRRLRDHGYNV